ncbi:hypothetical protein [Niastella populi]|uniref:6-bladed beta-propeller n=1 Tax=Niastella populi TaxID=550983 RepID=A0A1V9FNI4_9BACT|nr:hypothetical protein [Niastella populi]OQP59831.1 hypothetical protein A4R26_20820 [Niastella populi]
MPKFTFQVIDSFSTTLKGAEIVGIEVNRNTSNLLWLDNRMGSTVYETDNHGNILHHFAPLGEGPDKIGAMISNIGYFSDSTVIISAERGYYICDMDGHILRKFGPENPETVAGYEKKLRWFRNTQGDTIAASVFRSPLSYDFLVDNTAGSKKFIDDIRYLTLQNMNTGHYDLKFGFEKGGLHKQYKYDFRERALFEYLPLKRSFYLIYAPDPNIYVYSDSNGFTVPQTIPMYLDHFQMPIKYKIGEKGRNRDYNRSVIVNSALDNLYAGDSSLLLSYRTGMPASAYDKEITTNEKAASVFGKYVHYYCVLFQNNRQVSGEIEMPLHCYQVAFYKSPDYVVLSYKNFNEPEEGNNKYYVCRLVH